MKTIVKMKFGSHLYGLSTANSDTDIKGIYIPDYRDIILQQVPKTSINTTTGSDVSKNSSEDIDTEMFTLQGFIKLASQGQTVVTDMLFAPKNVIIESSPEWDYIQANKEKLLIGSSTSFISYCFQQANKYGIKGSRISTIEKVIDFLNNKSGKFYNCYENAKKDLNGMSHLEFIKLPIKKGSDQSVDAIDICGRKFGVNIDVEYMKDSLAKILKNYGDRAKQAQLNKNIDWKALSHALRICFEAEELLTMHKVTFPFTGYKQKLLLDIKLGNIDYNIISNLLETKMNEIKKLEKSTTLPEKINQEFWNNFIFDCYSKDYK